MSSQIQSNFVPDQLHQNLLDYINLEHNSYHSLINSYPALDQIIEAVESNELED